MSRFFVGLVLWALLLALAACGGDSKVTDPKDTELAEMADTVVSTFDDLTVCTNKREGATAYVEDEKKAYVCDGDDWTEDDSLTDAIRSDSEKKSSSSAKAKSSSDETSDSSSNAKSSSSIDGKSNSSDEEISSSSFDFSAVSLASPCKTAAEDNCEYGTLTDDRDGQTYKTVKIGEQWWMAENLNYRYIQQIAEEDSSSYCYNDDPAYCEKYGRLYQWRYAFACPKGWHLPNITEWKILFAAVGGDSSAGIKLKSTEGWNDKWDGTNGNGLDSYGFSALPAGHRNTYDFGFENRVIYSDQGLETFFWSSEDSDSWGGRVYLDNNDSYVYFIGYSIKDLAYSVRCIGYEYGTLTDNRDGQIYRTVKIGEQWWMAENLNYGDIQQTAEEDSSSYCYGNASANCEKYGRLYPWNVAMGICPEGWHLPDTTEWNTLFTAVGGETSAGISLKAKDGWNSSWKNNGYGSDSFGFSALLAGYRTDGGVYYASNNSAGFWTSTEYASNRAYYMYLYYDYDSGKLNDDPKDYAYSVRCLKD